MSIAILSNFSGRFSDNKLLNMVIALAGKEPSRRFIVFTDNVLVKQHIEARNIEWVLLDKLPGYGTISKLTIEPKVVKLLNSYSIQALITEVPFTTKKLLAKQYWWIENPVGLDDKKAKAAEFITKILVPDDAIKCSVAKQCHIAEEKIKSIYYGLPVLDGILGAREVRQQFTDGNAYFLFLATQYSRSVMITVLKAFSIFKKWQLSSFKLVVLIKDTVQEGLIPAFDQYKYKEDIVMIDYDDSKVHSLIRSSFANIILEQQGVNNCFGLIGLNENRPLITLPENMIVFGEAAFYTDVSESVLAEGLMQLYKNESAVAETLSHSHIILANYSWERVAQLLLEEIDA